MAQDLAALRVSLEMQTAAFERGMNKVTTQLNKTEQRFRRAQRTATQFAGVLAAAFSVQKIRGVIEFGDNIAKMSRTLGLSAEQFQAYSFAAERAGIATGQFQSNMTAFVKRVGEAQAGMGPLVSGLKNMNAGLLESVRNARNQNEAFNLIADAIQNAGSATEAAAIANAAFSRSGVQMVEMLRGGSQGLAEMRAEAERLGVILSDDLARSAERLNDQITNLSLRLKVAFSTAILSTIEQFRRGFAAFGQDLERLRDAFFATYNQSILFRNSVVALGGFIGAKLLPIIGAVALALKRLALSNPFTALALGATVLIANWEKVSAFFRFKLPSAWESMKAAWYEVLGIMMEGMIIWGEGVIKRFESIINGIISGFNKVIEFSNNTFKTSFATFGEVDLMAGMNSQLESFELAVLEAVGAGMELDAAYARAMQTIREEALKSEQAVTLFGGAVRDVTDDVSGSGGKSLGQRMLGDITTMMQTAMQQFQGFINQAEALRDRLDPGRVIRREIEALEFLLEHNLITLEEYAAGARLILERGITPKDNPIRTYIDDITDAISDLNTRFADTLIQSLKDGEDAFKAFANAAIEELTRIMLSKAFEGVFAAFGNWAGGLFSGGGGGLSSGSPGPTGIPGLAGPAGIPGGGPGPVGMAGPSAFGGGAVGVLKAPVYGHGHGGAGRSGVNVTVNNNAPVDVEVQEKQTTSGVNIDLIIEQKVAQSMSRGGLDRVMQSNFGASRRGF